MIERVVDDGKEVMYSKETGRPITKYAETEEETVWDFIERCFEEGKYKYDKGKVYRMYEFRGRGKWLKDGEVVGTETPRGYISTSLRFNGKYHQVGIHRMVYVAFYGSRDIKKSNLVINHINGIKDDNRIENLELVTPKENIRHAWRTGLMDNEMHGNSKLTWSKVREIRRKYRSGEYTQKQLAEEYGVIQGTISKVILNQSWKEDE